MLHESPSWRGLFFAVGDLLFLLFVATASAAAMHLFHELHWNLVVTLLLGMVTAMAAQTVLALAIALILGSIESMVPSMLVAMSQACPKYSSTDTYQAPAVRLYETSQMFVSRVLVAGDERLSAQSPSESQLHNRHSVLVPGDPDHSHGRLPDRVASPIKESAIGET